MPEIFSSKNDEVEQVKKVEAQVEAGADWKNQV
jgi:hypothetical protein